MTIGAAFVTLTDLSDEHADAAAPMFWRDVHGDAPGGPWLGLELVVPRSAPPGRPPLHMQAGGMFFLRLMAGDRPLLWARVDSDYWGYDYLLSAPEQGRLCLPPLTSALARSAGGDFQSAPWFAAWARIFAKMLEESHCTALDGGRWWLTPCSVHLDDGGWRHFGRPSPAIPPAVRLQETLAQAAQGHSEWDLSGDEPPPLAMRPASPADDGRVKAWRRSLREGCLPPVVLLWISGLCTYVILDGHDRLHAALLEGTVPPALALLSLQESRRVLDIRRRDAIAAQVSGRIYPAPDLRPSLRPFSVETANKLLVDAFDDRPRLVLSTRAWPLVGGVSSWFVQVQRRLEELPHGDHAMVVE